ncbi:MAG: electron transport complex subunit RsxC [Gammaproteobacteria bacterium]|nr:electron transport complex subunit RsxC [Gammaproteobacteria bacterium]MCP5137212.1 electron transport complex subunit RsxC [Gammaproteobacteria bacterium]
MLWRFHGGLKLAEHKHESNRLPSTPVRLPKTLTVPLHQHIGLPAEAIVQVGNHVLKGQRIADGVDHISAAVHAPSSGTVVAIEPRPIPHPSGLSALCVVIDTDGRDQWIDREACTNFLELDRREIIRKIHDAGIVGLGGAVFPTHAKVCCPVVPTELLIINGAECEPYISCDDRLMRERPAQIIEGINVLMHALGTERCIIGVEDNKQEAIDSLNQILMLMDEGERIQVRALPTLYPTGGERQLIRVLTGREVPKGGLPANIGIMCQNVGTAAAVYEAVVQGSPLISRMVTVTGAGVAVQQNVEALIGTPMIDLIDQCGGYEQGVAQLVMGGPMMGFALHRDDLPIVKSTNCVLAADKNELPTRPTPLPCIRCGECVKVCPAQLLPQQLYWYARAKDFEKVQEYKLDACIECGACAYVCPSQLPLVDYYRYAKSQIRAQARDRIKADQARQRHEARDARIAREAAEREARRNMKKAALNAVGDDADKDSKRAAVAAAVERARAKKAGQQADSPLNPSSEPAE